MPEHSSRDELSARIAATVEAWTEEDLRRELAACELQLTEARAENARLAEEVKILNQPPLGHEKPCHICGESCDAFVGNPAFWPVALPFSGMPTWYHAGCVAQKLEDGELHLQHKADAHAAVNEALDLCRHTADEWMVLLSGNPELASLKKQIFTALELRCLNLSYGLPPKE